MIEKISKIGLCAKYSENIINYVADKGYDKTYGARPIERFIRNKIEDTLSEKFLWVKLKIIVYILILKTTK